MAKKNVFYGLETYFKIQEMERELKEYGLYVSEGKNWVDKAQLVIRTLFRETKSLRFLFLSIFLVLSDWDAVLGIVTAYSAFIGISEFNKRSRG